jgi:hypothetical protein
LPAANALIFALLITEIAKAFEKFAFANFLEESNYKTWRLSGLSGEKEKGPVVWNLQA